jgi:hypothetical protein
MTQDPARIDPRRRLVAAAILLFGLGSALVIFVTAAPDPASAPGGRPEDSKQYLRDMELYGGKANVLASEYRQWFESLWQGRRLAGTVVALTLAALLFFLVASTPLPPGADPPPGSERGPGQAGP